MGTRRVTKAGIEVALEYATTSVHAVMFTGSASDDQCYDIRNAAVDAGHIVDIRDDSDLASADLGQWDVIWLHDPDSSTSARTFLERISSQGKPGFLTGHQRWASASTASVGLPAVALLTSTGEWEILGSWGGAVTVLNSSHDANLWSTSTSTGVYDFMANAEFTSQFAYDSSTGAWFLGTPLLYNGASTGDLLVVAISSGSTLPSSTWGPSALPSGCRIMWAGFDARWASSPYAADFLPWIGDALRWVAGISSGFVNPPNQPTLTASSIGYTRAKLTGSAYSHPDSVPHKDSWWMVTPSSDTGYSSPEYSSSWTSTLKTVNNLSTGTLTSNVDYISKVRYRDNNNVASAWSANSTFTTLATTALAAIKVSFRSSTGEISSTWAGTTSTVYASVLLEGVTIPAGTTAIRVFPYKKGTESATVYIKNVQLDRGHVAGGYHPAPFLPERDSEVDVPFSYKNLGVSTSTALALDWSTSRKQRVSLTKDTTLTFSGVSPGGEYRFYIEHGSTAADVTWPSAVRWAGGTAPTLSTSTGAVDIIELDAQSSTAIHGSVKALDSQ